MKVISIFLKVQTVLIPGQVWEAGTTEVCTTAMGLATQSTSNSESASTLRTGYAAEDMVLSTASHIIELDL